MLQGIAFFIMSVSVLLVCFLFGYAIGYRRGEGDVYKRQKVFNTDYEKKLHGR